MPKTKIESITPSTPSAAGLQLTRPSGVDLEYLDNELVLIQMGLSSEFNVKKDKEDEAFLNHTITSLNQTIVERELKNEHHHEERDIGDKERITDENEEGEIVDEEEEKDVSDKERAIHEEEDGEILDEEEEEILDEVEVEEITDEEDPFPNAMLTWRYYPHGTTHIPSEEEAEAETNQAILTELMRIANDAMKEKTDNPGMTLNVKPHFSAYQNPWNTDLIIDLFEQMIRGGNYPNQFIPSPDIIMMWIKRCRLTCVHYDYPWLLKFSMHYISAFVLLAGPTMLDNEELLQKSSSALRKAGFGMVSPLPNV